MSATASSVTHWSGCQRATPEVRAAMRPLVDRLASRIRLDAELGRLVLPPLPDTVIQVREKLRDPDVGVETICAAIARDPVLTAHLLRIANSGAFYAPKPFESLRPAIIRLGNAVVENVLLMAAVARVFSVGGRSAIRPHLERLWAHSTLVAAVAEVLAQDARHLQSDVAILAALMHDIGAVPLIVQVQKLPSVFNNPALLGHLVHELHTELGQVLLRSWSAPEVVLEVVTQHEYLTRAVSGPADYVELVATANVLANYTSEDEEDPPWNARACAKFGLDHDRATEIMEQARQKVGALTAGMLSQQ